MQRTGVSPYIIYALLLLGCSLSLRAHATLDLNGLAIHSELSKDQYIAALYLENLETNAKQALLSDQRKRMEIKVVTPRLLSRKFKRQWIEGVAINAGNNELKSHAQNLADFSNMLKVKLVKDDTLTIERTFRRGVEISINGVLLGSIKDTTFFDLLLRAWIGPVPPSSGFKEALLAGGSVEPGLLSRYKDIRTTSERVAKLEAAILGVTAGGATRVATAAPAATTTDSAATDTTPSEDTTAEADTVAPEESDTEGTEATEQVVAEATASSEAQIEPATEASELEAADAATDAPLIAAEIPDDPGLEPEELGLENEELVAAATLENTITAASEEDIFDEEGEDDFSYTAADLLSRQLYISKLTRWTRGYVKYPSAALRRNQEGSVRVTVIIDREGKVQSSELTAESEHSSLNKEAVRAVKKASPYPAMPDIIKGDTFIFTVPIAFNLRPN